MIQVLNKYGQLKTMTVISYTGTVTDVTASLPLLSSGGATPNISLGINSITNNYFRQSLGLSVVGRNVNSPGNVADIVAGSNYTILRRTGTSLGFGGLVAEHLNPTYSAGQTLTTDGSGNLTWAAAASQDAFKTIETDSGDVIATVPNDTMQIVGSGGIATSAVGKILTIDGSAITPVIIWTTIVADQTLVLGNNYITNNATKLELTLPTDNTKKTVRVASQLGGWKIIVPPSWEILIADEVITIDIESILDTDSIELLSLGNNKYKAVNLIGNIIYNN
jgi:hypothetical protein